MALMLQIQPAKKTAIAAMMVGRFPKHTAVGVQKTFPTPKAKTGHEMRFTNWALSTRNSMATSPKPVVMPAAYIFARNTIRLMFARAKCLMYAGHNC